MSLLLFAAICFFPTDSETVQTGTIKPAMFVKVFTTLTVKLKVIFKSMRQFGRLWGYR